MTYEKQIMDLPIDEEKHIKSMFCSGSSVSNPAYAYYCGHRDALRAAAEIAMKADLEIEQKDKRIAKLENMLDLALGGLMLHSATAGLSDNIFAELKEADR